MVSKKAFTVTGIMGGETYTVTWEAGEVRGDLEAVEAIQRRARYWEGRIVGPPTGPFTETDHLRSALSAILVMDSVFQEILSTKGRIPSAPRVPPGAVA